MRIGWATERSELNHLKAIGDDEFSIGLDAFNGTITNDKVEYQLSGLKGGWKPGDVVGCLIDVSKESFAFYLNGEKISQRWKLFKLNSKSIYFSKQPYYAAISLYLHQQCRANYGSRPFKFPTKRIDFLDFHKILLNRKMPVRVSHSIMEGNKCLLCKVQNATLKFSKCNHWELCVNCAPKLLECPICETTK